MSINDLKMYSLNTATMILSFTNIENTLKIILLLVSITYTIIKTIELLKHKKNGKTDE